MKTQSKYVITLPVKGLKRTILNTKINHWTENLIIAGGFLGLALTVLCIVKSLSTATGFFGILRIALRPLSITAIGIFILNGIDQFLSLTWAELDKDNNRKLALFNKITVCFLPLLMWITILLAA